MSVTLGQHRTSRSSGRGKSTGGGSQSSENSNTTSTQDPSGGLGSQAVESGQPSSIVEDTLNYVLATNAPSGGSKSGKKDKKKAQKAEKKAKKTEAKAQKKADKREVKEAGYIAKYEELHDTAEAAQAELAQMLRCGDFLLAITQALNRYLLISPCLNGASVGDADCWRLAAESA